MVVAPQQSHTEQQIADMGLYNTCIQRFHRSNSEDVFNTSKKTNDSRNLGRHCCNFFPSSLTYYQLEN